MKDANTKGRLLFLEHYLNNHTDEEHAVTADDLMHIYEENGYKANRNTIRDDIEVLQSIGIDVISELRDRHTTIYIGSRLFEPAEVKTLADAVASSRFITKEKSETLILKLSELVDEHNRQRVIKNAISANRLKTDSPGIFRSVDTISAAIEGEKKISFQYIDYLPTKETVLRHDGKVYIVSPQAMVWNDDRYYVPSYSEEKNRIIPYRIDRMRNVVMLNESAHIVPNFNIADYSRMALQMFEGSMGEREVLLEAENKYLLNIIDRFGDGIETTISDDDHFTVKVTVRPSATFFAWVFQFCGGIRILEPDEVIDGFRIIVNESLRKLD